MIWWPWVRVPFLSSPRTSLNGSRLSTTDSSVAVSIVYLCAEILYLMCLIHWCSDVKIALKGEQIKKGTFSGMQHHRRTGETLASNVVRIKYHCRCSPRNLKRHKDLLLSKEIITWTRIWSSSINWNCWILSKCYGGNGTFIGETWTIKLLSISYLF